MSSRRAARCARPARHAANASRKTNETGPAAPGNRRGRAQRLGAGFRRRTGGPRWRRCGTWVQSWRDQRTSAGAGAGRAQGSCDCGAKARPPHHLLTAIQRASYEPAGQRCSVPRGATGLLRAERSQGHGFGDSVRPRITSSHPPNTCIPGAAGGTGAAGRMSGEAAMAPVRFKAPACASMAASQRATTTTT